MSREMLGSWYYVYLLESDKTKWIYIGCTRDLKRRMAEHMNGDGNTTKRMLPVKLLYYEAYRSQAAAFQREKMLKQYGSSLAKLKIRIGREGEPSPSLEVRSPSVNRINPCKLKSWKGRGTQPFLGSKEP